MINMRQVIILLLLFIIIDKFVYIFHELDVATFLGDCCSSILMTPDADVEGMAVEVEPITHNFFLFCYIQVEVQKQYDVYI